MKQSRFYLLERDAASEKFDLFAVLAIFFAGIIAALVCFGVLKSQARLNQAGSVSGAIAGALITMGALARFYKQLRGSRGELEKLASISQHEIQQLRERNQELEQKLIRGAPRPEDFEIEVDEKQKIVLARPRTWKPQGGILFDFESGGGTRGDGDLYPARFTTSFWPIDEQEFATQKDFYEVMQRAYRQGPGAEPFRTEFIHIGGDTDAIQTLKVTVETYAMVRVFIDRFGKESTERRFVTKDEFEAYVYSIVEKILHSSSSQQDAGWRALKQITDLKQQIAPLVASLIEKGEVRGIDEIEEAVHEFLAEAAPSRDETALESTPTDSSEEAIQGADELPKGTQGDMESIQVLPIGRLLFYCYHAKIGNIFYFEFSDDASDFIESSVLFSKIVKSVRFLA